jgi:hypothetical protein
MKDIRPFPIRTMFTLRVHSNTLLQNFDPHRSSCTQPPHKNSQGICQPHRCLHPRPFLETPMKLPRDTHPPKRNTPQSQPYYRSRLVSQCHRPKADSIRPNSSTIHILTSTPVKAYDQGRRTTMAQMQCQRHTKNKHSPCPTLVSFTALHLKDGP